MKDLSFLNNLTIAHRGIWNDKIPENSLPAFRLAIRKKIPIELDIQILKDHQIIVFHDRNLKRMTGLNKEVKDCTYSDIKKLHLKDTKHKIPLLSEVLALVNGRVLLDIEFKGDEDNSFLERKCLALLNRYKGKFIIKSFNPKIIHWFKVNKPSFIRGLLVNKQHNTLIRWIVNMYAKPDFLVYEKKHIPKKSKKPFLVYTIKSIDEINDRYSIIADNIFEQEKTE